MMKRWAKKSKAKSAALVASPSRRLRGGAGRSGGGSGNGDDHFGRHIRFHHERVDDDDKYNDEDENDAEGNGFARARRAGSGGGGGSVSALACSSSSSSSSSLDASALDASSSSCLDGIGASLLNPRAMSHGNDGNKEAMGDGDGDGDGDAMGAAPLAGRGGNGDGGGHCGQSPTSSTSSSSRRKRQMQSSPSSSSSASSSSSSSASASSASSSPFTQSLDCYPYTFTPLLLFAPDRYFEKGYSNYNAVARFFDPVLLPGGRGTRYGSGNGNGTGSGNGNDGGQKGDKDATVASGGRTTSGRGTMTTTASTASGGGGGDGRNGTFAGATDTDTDTGIHTTTTTTIITTGVDMLRNVLYERTNLLYEDLLKKVLTNESIVICCIDAHFTAFQCLRDKKGRPCLLYYDPLRPSCYLITNDGARILGLYLLMKCNYGDGQHVQDNKEHYLGPAVTNSTRRMIYHLWKRIHTLDGVEGLSDVKWDAVPLKDLIGKWVLINDKKSGGGMSTQLTKCTCYFQTYLFAVLCKVGEPSVGRDGKSIEVRNVDELERVTTEMCRYLLEFFVHEKKKKKSADEGDGVPTMVLRPLSNSNFVLDFPLYDASPYYALLSQYLKQKGGRVPEYGTQYGIVLQYYRKTRKLHRYGKFTLGGEMSTSPNAKSLQFVNGTDDAVRKLAQSDYYKYRAANFMFGFNASIMLGIHSFCEFNSLRKNQLLRFYNRLGSAVAGCATAIAAKDKKTSKYRDYYFMPQFEVGQKELVDIHHYTFLIDHCSISDADADLLERVHSVNRVLVERIFFSTQKRANYDKFSDIKKAKKIFRFFLNTFLSTKYFEDFIGLGFAEINPKEKEINSLTQTVFYATELMRTQANRQEYEFEKECINQMARSSLRKYLPRYEGGHDADQKYKVQVKIGWGYTYSKYNTLMHFLNVVGCYWRNPDLSNIQVFGKDIRALLAVSCQKIFFDKDHSGFYHYGPFEIASSSYYSSSVDLDLAVATDIGQAGPGVSRNKRNGTNMLVIVDRVYEFSYLRNILANLFNGTGGVRFKSDNEVINLCLLSLMLDFSLYEEYVGLLNLPFLQDLQHIADTRELQVEVANLIYEFDRKNNADAITRSRVEKLIFEVSYKFLVNKDFKVHSEQFKLISALNADPDYQSYVLLVKIYMSLCQINKSVEVDYYKVHCNGEFRIIIPQSFSKTTSDYLDEITRRYTWSEKDSMMVYDDLSVFDLRPHQPEIKLFRVRFDSATSVQSMVKYIEISNVFRVIDSKEMYLVFMADNVLLVGVSKKGGMTIRINKVAVEVATVFFNDVISFVPCFKYSDSEDIILFASRNIHYCVDNGGQFSTDYYGMKHEIIECINSEEVFVDLNDEHVFKSFKLSELLTESKTVIYFPDYLLQVSNREQLINLLDLAAHLRNVSFFILVLFFLRRSSVALEYVEQENSVQKISGPWRHAILYVLDRAGTNLHYDKIFKRQFFDLNQYEDMSLDGFIEVLCDNFTKYQRFIEGQYQIVPTEKQKAFLKRIICSEECFHFSEVGSGKTKVILPLLCQTFLSNNVAAHRHLARGGKLKDVLIILVPEHLLSDALTQVFRYCLNLNFREEYRVYDDVFTLMHRDVQLGKIHGKVPAKQIFVTSFNQLKKALTYDPICAKVFPHREHILVVSDEVDDFLDRNKLVFNICSNKSNSFDRGTLELFFELSRAVYYAMGSPEILIQSSSNPAYWRQLFEKFGAIHTEIQNASWSINKSFGIFNQHTLRHCKSNIVYDIEGYKSLIARPYESVNRAMPGSYYSDVERTIFLTFVILTEDVAKYDDLFQGERKFISFEYWNEYFVHQLDYDDLVYGHEKLSEIVEKHPETKEGLTRFLFEIILRRMEIRDKSRSVNSIDIIFNLDTIGFTGTPFLDNYPSADYIRCAREDDIPDLIDRSFYAYTSDNLTVAEFENRFARFQGQNSDVRVKYVSSDFIRDNADEIGTLRGVFEREERVSRLAPTIEGGAAECETSIAFNAIVDLCGIFKRSSIHDVCDLIRKRYGDDQFHFVYHIHQSDNSDRVLCLKTGNDVQYDEEFYNHLSKTYGADLRDKIFFFIDNRNVIGKDIPFQLVYNRQFDQPLFRKSVILAHDVDDFSKIWQAMGRSRTMNKTIFSIYKSGMPVQDEEEQAHDIKKQSLTRKLYVRNCDCKMAGNISSIYLTLIALFNLSKGSFYYCDEIVNTFLEKMENTIHTKVARHEEKLVRSVLGTTVPARILLHILTDKFKKSSNKLVADEVLTDKTLEQLLRCIVKQKFEQRTLSRDVFDAIILFLSGEQQSHMEISYTKQHQKQKQKQQNKVQDSDAMGVFDKKNQITLSFTTNNYFEGTRPWDDSVKLMLNLPVSVPIITIEYNLHGYKSTINIYPTVQFLYSHHIEGAYVNDEVNDVIKAFDSPPVFYANFFTAVEKEKAKCKNDVSSTDYAPNQIFQVKVNYIRQNPQYSIAALKEGMYIIGMKDQFNVYDLKENPLRDGIQYVADEAGFVLFDRTNSKSIDNFGPYHFEQYIIMEAISKQEIAQNVLDYYFKHKETLQRGLDSYGEKQGKGFICWRFLINETAKSAAVRSPMTRTERKPNN